MLHRCSVNECVKLIKLFCLRKRTAKPELHDYLWLWDVAFFFIQQILQTDDKPARNMFGDVNAFAFKVRIWVNQIREDDLSNFIK